MMKTKDLPTVTFALIEKMKSDGYSQTRIEDTTSPFQTVLRHPLLISFEFLELGSYKKTHQRGSTTQIPLIYGEYIDHVNCMSIGLKKHGASVETAQKYSKKQKEDLIDWLKKNL